MFAHCNVHLYVYTITRKYSITVEFEYKPMVHIVDGNSEHVAHA